MRLASKGVLHLTSLAITLSVYLYIFINSLWHCSLLFLGGCTFFSIYNSEPGVKEYKTVFVDEKNKRILGENLFMISLFLHFLPDTNCD